MRLADGTLWVRRLTPTVNECPFGEVDYVKGGGVNNYYGMLEESQKDCSCQKGQGLVMHNGVGK